MGTADSAEVGVYRVYNQDDGKSNSNALKGKSISLAGVLMGKGELRCRLHYLTLSRCPPHSEH